MKLQSHLTSHYLINFRALKIPSFTLKRTPSIHRLFSLPLHGSFFHYCKSSSKYCKTAIKRQLSYLYSEIMKSKILLLVVIILLAADATRIWHFYRIKTETETIIYWGFTVLQINSRDLSIHI